MKYYLHDEGLLSPSQEMINLLSKMRRRAYDLSVYFLRNERNELIFALDHILFHLINTRKFCLFPS